ncbi:hypothetical protein OGZ37_13045 [Lactococcus lactis]|uniref:hypothetical protein n=1 Tax=Lactococcus lactis TaxID=1358 RepID=UPI0024188DD4|nr:hypothetical protein [Lactococcus lactis]MDG4967484.1 hypothetical protein [Lactococcus lactis]
MDIVEELLKKAKKELEKIKIQTLGIHGSMTSMGQRKTAQENAEEEVESSKTSLSKNTSELKSAIKGKFSDKLTETFEEQEQLLDNI